MAEFWTAMIGAIIGGALTLTGGWLEARRARTARLKDERRAGYMEYLHWHDGSYVDEKWNGKNVRHRIPASLLAQLSGRGSSIVHQAVVLSRYIEVLSIKAAVQPGLVNQHHDALNAILSQVIQFELTSRPTTGGLRALLARRRAQRKIAEIVPEDEPFDLFMRDRLAKLRRTIERDTYHSNRY